MHRFAFLLCYSLMSLVVMGQDTPPNIVVIFIDDMGYADIGPFGAEKYKTPNLNRMAAEGRKFTDFLVSSAVCSASRSALMTGCYHRRVGISGALGPKSDIGLAENETTIAELCKSKGYATAAFGKWHLGHDPKFLPTNHGFDEYYGIPYSNDMWPLHPGVQAARQQNAKAPSPWASLPMIRATTKSGVKIVNDAMRPEDQAAMTGEFTRRAVDFIKQNVDQPFFLYLPHPMVHVPLYASEDFLGKSGAGLFGDVVTEVDWSVGQILSAIEDIGVERNTLVIFSSDNGPWLSYGDHSGSALPLREGKGTMFEGGVREPTIMWWKGKIPAFTTCDKLCSTIDILPTIAKLIGAELPDHKIDGKDISPLMFGDGAVVSPRDSFCGYYAGGQLQTIRNERFKLVFPHTYRTLNGHPGGTMGLPIAYKNAKAELALYDLDNDLSESTNVIEKFPEEAAKLQSLAEEARSDLGDTLTGRKGTGARPHGRIVAGDERLPLRWDQ